MQACRDCFARFFSMRTCATILKTRQARRPFPPAAPPTRSRAWRPAAAGRAQAAFRGREQAGRAGSIAAEFVAKSAPDGYTLMVTTNTPQAANVSLFKKLPYDPVKDFEPVVRCRRRRSC
jgi:hypothetical protein